MIKKNIKKVLPAKIWHKLQEKKKDILSKKSTYSQCGEDVIVEYLFKTIGIETIRYLDIGAHHPYFLSNTYLFYKKGSHGVCVEPDLNLFKKISAKRKKDICLNVGIGEENSPAKKDFYLMHPPTLNTFSKESADSAVQQGHSIEKVIQVELIPINEILSNYFKNGIDFISLDTEGYDQTILSSIDFKKYRPKVFCIETVEYSGNNSATSQQSVVEFMTNRGYIKYADTHINTIFADKNIFK